MKLEVLREALSHQKELHNHTLLRIKERKAKIRKFMLFVNNTLNETENEVKELCNLYYQLEHLVHEEITLAEPTTNKMINDTEDNSGDKSFKKDLSTSKSPHDTVNKCGLQASHHSSQLKTAVIQSYESFDETVGVEMSQDKQQSQINGLTADNVPDRKSCQNDFTEQEAQESSFLSPVTDLLNDVLTCVRPVSIQATNDDVDDVEVSTCNMVPRIEKDLYDNVSSNPSSVQFTKSVNKTKISNSTHLPIMIKSKKKLKETTSTKDNDITAVDISTSTEDNDITAVDVTKNDIIVTKVKQKSAVWPIGYSKKASRGDLIVEAADPHRPSKRVRQTRLDCYLAKAADSSVTSEQHTLIAMNSIRRHGETVVEEMDVNDTTSSDPVFCSSESEDEIGEINLEVLGSVNTGRGSNVKHSYQSTDQSMSGTQQSTFNKPLKKAQLDTGEVVRGKARRQLTGYKCKQCYEYYSSLDLSEEEIRERLNDVCRHRAFKPPMETPPNFWNMSILSNMDSLN